MKKSIISGVLALTVFFGVSQTIATPVAHAQNISIQQLIQLFIYLDIIPADKVSMVEAAFGMVNTTTTSSPVATSSADCLMGCMGDQGQQIRYSITAVNPSNGSFVTGQNINVSFNATGFDPSKQYRAEITMNIPGNQNGADSGFYLAKPCYTPKTSTNQCTDLSVSNGSNSYSLTIPSYSFTRSSNYQLTIKIIDWTSFTSGIGEGIPYIASANSSSLIFITNPQNPQTTTTTNFSNPSIKVISPNGGELDYTGKIIPISFSDNLTDKQDPTGVTLQLYSGLAGSSGSSFVETIVSNWIGGSPYNWNVLEKLPTGQYSIYASAPIVGSNLSEGGVYDSSDGTFTLMAP